jgi:TPR repeat protein
MFNIGAAYFNGEGVPPDPIEAYAWFVLAQDNGSKRAAEAVRRSEADLGKLSQVDAWLRLGGMYDDGKEVDRSTEKATYWYKRAAENGSAPGRRKIGEPLGKWQSTRLSTNNKVLQVRRRPEICPGMYCLGRIYKAGLGTSPQPDMALTWFRRAADLGNGLSARELAGMCWKQSRSSRITAQHICGRSLLSAPRNRRGEHGGSPPCGNARERDSPSPQTRGDIRERSRHQPSTN